MADKTVGRNERIRFSMADDRYFDVELVGNQLNVRCMDGVMSVLPDCSNVVKLRILSPFVLEHEGE